MDISTLGRYLIGQRAAILQIADCRHALWLGLLFVLSAGFAREYDGEDLLHEPWYLLVPLVASLGTCTLLFLVLWVVGHGWRTIPNAGRKYTQLLTLYWLTAPLAWVYAIPVERMLDAGDAMAANLWLLGIVAAWRVALIIRVVSVLFEISPLRAFWPVMLFADTVMVQLIAIMPKPILEFMGGVRLSESEQVLQSTTLFLMFVGIMSWPLWAVGTLVVLFRNYDRQKSQEPPGESVAPTAGRVSLSAWILAGCALVIWIPILPFTQPPQQRRHQAEQLFQRGQFAEGFRYLSQHDRADFPLHWDPPPRIAFAGERRLRLLEVLPVMHSLPAGELSPWVEDIYLRKFVDLFAGDFYHWGALSHEELDQIVTLAERHPQRDSIFEFENYMLERESKNEARPEPLRARLHKLLENYDWYRDRRRREQEWEAEQKTKQAAVKPEPEEMSVSRD